MRGSSRQVGEGESRGKRGEAACLFPPAGDVPGKKQHFQNTEGKPKMQEKMLERRKESCVCSSEKDQSPLLLCVQLALCCSF